MMNFIDRLMIEYNELNSRLESLKPFIDSDKFKALNGLQQYKLREQLSAMETYKECLVSRIDNLDTLPSKFLFTFSEALKYLNKGRAVRRLKWEQTGHMVFKQVPAEISDNVIPNMQSLPNEAKSILMNSKNKKISYNNQILLFNEFTTIADNYIPSAEDLFADDWCLVNNRL